MLYYEPAKQALVRAINANNSLKPPLHPDDVTFSNPEIWIQGSTNTRITVTVNNTDYSGSDIHYYNRHRIYDFFAGHSIPGNASDYPDTRSAMTAFYNRYKLPFDPTDLVNSTISPGAVAAVIQGRTNSIMFIPNLTVTLPFAG